MIVHCRNCKNRYTTDCPMLFEEYVEWDDDVELYNYDYIFNNNCSIEDLENSFMDFFKRGILNE